MAIANPIGRATKMAIKEVNSVPESRGSIPYRFFVNRGVHSVSVKNSTMETSLKNLKASMASTRTIPIVVRIVIKALSSKNFSIINSFFLTINHAVKKK
jgi:hypothetical protein